LILDEPTNDLDIDTLELLESLLQDYKGTLFLVSHDREFLENTVTQVIAFEGNGVLDEFSGGYDDWQRFSQQREAEKVSNKPVTKKSGAKPTAYQPSIQRLSFNEQKELEALPQHIEVLESEQANINLQFTDANIYRDQPDLVKRLQERLAEIEVIIEENLSRWDVLEQRKKEK
jgi:ATP-binding cassette subfamily F protein uup